MAKYLDGIQQIDDVIQDFVTIGSGTINVTAGQQYPVTPDIVRPSKYYRNYVLVYSNKSGQTISSISLMGKNNALNSPIPNTDTASAVYLRTSLSVSVGSTNNRGSIDLTSEEPNPFLIGKAYFQFNLAAVTTAAGTIDWVLIGY